MIAYSRGDVVLVLYMYSDESGQKLRPGLIVSSATYHQSRQDLIAAITSNVTRRLAGDHVIADWPAAGLRVPSLVTVVLRTIKRPMIRRRLGALSAADLQAYDQQLRRSLAL
ncbi:MAG TPA: type II toxin-antitoxin system PemK/MazF family toxin [Chloroflexota bacterium]|jgi:mRNA interferase MazF